MSTQEVEASMAVAARGIASDATMELSEAARQAFGAPAPSGDPVDALAARVKDRASGAVDGLQVAAMLEADGVSDRTARVEYGFQDVFDLAEAVYVRVADRRPPARPLEVPPPNRRELLHGLLYLLPSALFPAVVAIVAPHPLVVALLTGGALGWVWAGAASWLAYQGLNVGDPRAAARVLIGASGLGVAVAAGLGVAVTAVAGGGIAAAALVPGVMVYQMAATLLVFHRHELLLGAVMLPAVGLGVATAVHRGGPGLARWALVVVAVTVLVALTLAMVLARRAGRTGPETPHSTVRALLRGRTGTFLLVALYAALSAAFLLHAQAPYLLTHFDVVVAGVPLIAAMGIVEWRARVFVERSRLLLHRVSRPRQFVRGVWRMLGTDLLLCWLAVAAGAVLLLAGLRWAGRLTPAGTIMAGAQVAVAGAYFLAFVMVAHGRYGWLCTALAVATAAHVGADVLLPRVAADAASDVLLFLASAVLLQVLLTIALVPVLGQARRYR
ncbi:hypothetical protein [Dactylosporangium sp. NPDC051541]|uniref:hypothetical protein n=1 Tax=Dactylosporangium sp. NPDC051541 TaxID=3363977 RepID=UPI00379CE136